MISPKDTWRKAIRRRSGTHEPIHLSEIGVFLTFESKGANHPIAGEPHRLEIS
jgi:hypothetical protein